MKTADVPRNVCRIQWSSVGCLCVCTLYQCLGVLWIILAWKKVGQHSERDANRASCQGKPDLPNKEEKQHSSRGYHVLMGTTICALSLTQVPGLADVIFRPRNTAEAALSSVFTPVRCWEKSQEAHSTALPFSAFSRCGVRHRYLVVLFKLSPEVSLQFSVERMNILLFAWFCFGRNDMLSDSVLACCLNVLFCTFWNVPEVLSSCLELRKNTPFLRASTWSGLFSVYLDSIGCPSLVEVADCDQNERFAVANGRICVCSFFVCTLNKLLKKTKHGFWCFPWSLHFRFSIWISWCTAGTWPSTVPPSSRVTFTSRCIPSPLPNTN